uniref:Uncharacterized protein n=1 Tax=Arcella intermedia TaxID=1963864 RepID=A0A6B2LLH3_9EUKA
MELFDTAGVEEWGHNYQEQYMRGAHGFIFLFSLTSRASFEHSSGDRDRGLRIKDVDVIPHVLVGNKLDLEGKRQVMRGEGQEMADNWGCPYFEVSAKTRENVVESIEAAVREVIKIVGLPKYKRKKGGCSLL